MNVNIGNLATSSVKNGGRRFICFLHRQTREIHQGGWTVLFQKVRLLIKLRWHLVGLLLTRLLVILVRLLRPLVVIRFGPLRSDRIGHFAANTEVYLCERDAGLHGQRIIDIFYHSSPVCNQQLKKMWDRTLHVSRFANQLDRLNRNLPGGEKHVMSWRYNQDRDIHGLLAGTRAHLAFTPEEERLGRAALDKLGISEGSPFVCFHARDSAYLNRAFTSNLNFNYHNYRDANILNHLPAAEELVCRGYFTIRMGAVVKDPLNTSNPRIIDYATKYRTDFLDIFLGAKCRFFICDTAGIYAIPMIFRRPIAWVNFVPLEYAPTWKANGLFIPKKLWLLKEHRFMTFHEILESGVGRFVYTEKYEQLGIEVIENTPEEITALAIEMDERLKGTWETSEEDEELQRRFWSLFKPSELNRVFLSRIGADFLRQNRELLD